MIDKRLLKIASNTKFYGLKNIYTYKTKLKNSICGDKISIEISLKKNIFDRSEIFKSLPILLINNLFQIFCIIHMKF